MTEQADDRHLPLADVESEEYWAFAQRHELAVRYCDDCDLHFHYPRRRCVRCLGDNTSWKIATGRGTIYTYTEVQQAPNRVFRARAPYVIAIVELDNGARMMSNVDAEPGTVSIGQAVEVAWRDDGDVTLPIFVQAGS